jgi:tetratricopeptide (TPR) repeat protein
MKKLRFRFAVLALVLAGLTVPLFAQEAPQASSVSEHYQVFSDQGDARAMEIARTMEAALALFNDLFRFDLSRMAVKLRVRMFADRKDFDQYLTGLIGQTRGDFVFVSYSDPNRSELVGFNRPPAELNASLLHYGLIQFLNSFVPSAPLWLGEGSAAYLEASTYDPAAGRFLWQPNLAWLDTLKAALKSGTAGTSIEELLTFDKARAAREIATFYPLAWGLVHFLAESPVKRYNRLLWDSISTLQPALALAENSIRVKERIFAWSDARKLQADFQAYILGLRTFNDLSREGTELFGTGKLDEAEKAFNEALALRADSYVPYYYLGLIYYQRKSYAKAAEYYTRAMELGIEAALINYALGVNAFAEKKYDLASSYLRKAREVDPKAYGEKADSLLKRIEALK